MCAYYAKAVMVPDIRQEKLKKVELKCRHNLCCHNKHLVFCLCVYLVVIESNSLLYFALLLGRCLSLVLSQGSQILSGLSAEDHRTVLHMIKRAILSTDLTVYMEYVKTENVKVAVGQLFCTSCLTPFLCLSF